MINTSAYFNTTKHLIISQLVRLVFWAWAQIKFQHNLRLRVNPKAYYANHYMGRAIKYIWIVLLFSKQIFKKIMLQLFCRMWLNHLGQLGLIKTTRPGANVIKTFLVIIYKFSYSRVFVG
jgi:hypothetical protein